MSKLIPGNIWNRVGFIIKMDCILDLHDEYVPVGAGKSECFLNALNGKDNLMLFGFRLRVAEFEYKVGDDEGVEYLVN